jgi:hypothetical protein
MFSTHEESTAMVTCYVSEPGNGSPELFAFIEVPGLAELIALPDRNGEFEVESVRHVAQYPSGRQRPTVHIHLTISPRRTARVPR